MDHPDITAGKISLAIVCIMMTRHEDLDMLMICVQVKSVVFLAVKRGIQKFANS